MVDLEDAAVYYIASADQPDHQDSLEVEELVLADYVSSHSYLDSILTTINLEEVNLNVEFPEYGKRLMETPVENTESQAAIRTKTWGDNWQVDGVERFEEQVFIELLQDQKKKTEMSVLSPEIVPFLVPSSGQAKVIIGDQDLDSVSLLSEKMSEGSIEFSSSTTSEVEEESEDAEEVIQTSRDPPELPSPSVEVEEEEEERSSKLVLVSAPADMTVRQGRILALSCVVEGIKPIGGSARPSSHKIVISSLVLDVCWFHGEEALSSGEDCILQQRGNLHSILLTDLNTDQAGLYSLAAVNNNTEIWHSWRVTVLGNFIYYIIEKFVTNLKLQLS